LTALGDNRFSDGDGILRSG